MGQNVTTRGPRVLVIVSIYRVPFGVPIFAPQPHANSCGFMGRRRTEDAVRSGGSAAAKLGGGDQGPTGLRCSEDWEICSAGKMVDTRSMDRKTRLFKVFFARFGSGSACEPFPILSTSLEVARKSFPSARNMQEISRPEEGPEARLCRGWGVSGNEQMMAPKGKER